MRVVNGAQGIDSSCGSNYSRLRFMTAVQCEVFETVKGTKVPNNCRAYSSTEKGRNREKPLSTNPLCFAFSYNSRAINLVPKIGKKYYVLLLGNAYSEGEPSLGIVSPFGAVIKGIPSVYGGWQGLFRINGSMVENPKYFWSSGSVTVEQCRGLFQSKIAEIAL